MPEGHSRHPSPTRGVTPLCKLRISLNNFEYCQCFCTGFVWLITTNQKGKTLTEIIDSLDRKRISGRTATRAASRSRSDLPNHPEGRATGWELIAVGWLIKGDRTRRTRSLGGPTSCSGRRGQSGTASSLTTGSSNGHRCLDGLSIREGPHRDGAGDDAAGRGSDHSGLTDDIAQAGLIDRVGDGAWCIKHGESAQDGSVATFGGGEVEAGLGKGETTGAGASTAA